MTPRGFNKPLYILPFDHRGSFQKKMFGWDGLERGTNRRDCGRQTRDL